MLLFAALDAVIARALDEDLVSGDLTSEACVPGEARAEGEAIAKSELCVCGGPVFSRVFELVDRSVEVAMVAREGEKARAGRTLWRVCGAARSILMAERVALNFAQRLSGIATLTRKLCDARPPESATRICDTRKTTPGLRALERYAVRVGGGHNHRDNLGSAVLIKDNHIAVAGGVKRAIERARAFAPHTSRIEVEVASLAQLDEALAARADVVLLDNMSDELVTTAVARCRAATGAPIVEVSGGVTLARVPALCAAGVEVISVGALTHSAPAADISLELRLLA